MRNAIPLTNRALAPLLHLERKRSEVVTYIEQYATGHVFMDVAIGVAGLLPIPGAGIASIAAAIGAQGTVVYNPMSRDIVSIYHAVTGAADIPCSF